MDNKTDLYLEILRITKDKSFKSMGMSKQQFIPIFTLGMFGILCITIEYFFPKSMFPASTSIILSIIGLTFYIFLGLMPLSYLDKRSESLEILYQQVIAKNLVQDFEAFLKNRISIDFYIENSKSNKVSFNLLNIGIAQIVIGAFLLFSKNETEATIWVLLCAILSFVLSELAKVFSPKNDRVILEVLKSLKKRKKKQKIVTNAI